MYFKKYNNLVWSPAFYVPFDGSDGNGLATSPNVEVVNGCITYIYTIYRLHIGFLAMVAYSFDAAGNMCIYKSANYRRGMSPATDYWSSQMYRIGNTFFMIGATGETATFTLPNVFVSGGIFTVPNLVAIPSPTCLCNPAASLANTDFIQTSTTTGFIARRYAWSDGLGHSKSYEQIYSQGGALLSSGFTAEYFPPASPSNYDQRALTTIPSLNSNYISNKNGFQFATNFQEAALESNKGFSWFNTKMIGNYQGMSCGNASFLYLTSDNSQTQFLTRINGWNPGFSSAAYPFGYQSFEQYNLACATDTTGLFYVQNCAQDTISNWFSAIINKDYFVQINSFQSARVILGGAVMANQNKIYAGFTVGGAPPVGPAGYGSGQVYSASIAGITEINPIPNPSRWQGSLVNYHRAISPDGAFEA